MLYASLYEACLFFVLQRPVSPVLVSQRILSIFSFVHIHVGFTAYRVRWFATA